MPPKSLILPGLPVEFQVNSLLTFPPLPVQTWPITH